MTVAAERKIDAFDLAAAALIALGVVFRFLWLGNIPGMNGDEAWYGVQVVGPLRNIEWRTPNENLPNPFLIIPDWLLNHIFPPSAWTLRLPAALAGVICIAVAWFLWRAFLSRSSTRSAAILVATLPVTIAFSRIGWDPCESILVGMLVIYFSLTGRAFWTAISIFIAVWIHPTNVFLMPMVASHWLFRIWTADMQVGTRIRRTIALAISGIVLVGVMKPLFLSTGHAQTYADVLHPWTWIRYAWFSAELISGVSSYRYFAGPFNPGLDIAHVAVTGLLVVPALLAGCILMLRRKEWRPLSHLLGTAGLFIAFRVLAARRAMDADGDVRYGLVLIAPLLLAWIFSIESVFKTSRIPDFVILVIGAACLIVFGQQYFIRIMRTGGESHVTFRTAPVEPKEQAAALIRAHSCERKVVSAESWWLAEPLKYLLAKDAGTTVYKTGDVPDDALRGIPEGCVLAVSFLNTPMDTSMRSGGLTPEIVTDMRGEPLIEVWTVKFAH
jgi:hypothetical protein